MDATSTTRAGTEPVDLSGVPETMLPLCARAQHTLSPRPRFQDHDAAAARTGRPTAEGTARALTQHLPVLRARRAPRPRTGGWVCWGSPAHYVAAASHFRTGGQALPYGVRGLQNPASHFRTGGRDQGPVTGQTGERP